MAVVYVKPTEAGELKEKLVAINRVSKVTKGGRTFGFSALAVVGNGDGVVGHGLGKAKDVSECISKAVEDAKKNLIKFPLYNGTIPHEQLGKFGAGKVLLKPASDGTGLIAGGAMRAVLEIGGVHNILTKSQGSSNPHNIIKATIEALKSLRDPLTIAGERGLTLNELFHREGHHNNEEE